MAVLFSAVAGFPFFGGHAFGGWRYLESVDYGGKARQYRDRLKTAGNNVGKNPDEHPENFPLREAYVSQKIDPDRPLLCSQIIFQTAARQNDGIREGGE